MAEVLSLLTKNWAGILVVPLSLLMFVLAAQWFAWVAGWGRWNKTPADRKRALRFVIADFFVKLINDFPHLLALSVLLIFAVTIGLMLLPGLQKGDVVMMESGLKSVTATLGPFVASMIGFYFGEARRSQQPPVLPTSESSAAITARAQDTSVPEEPGNSVIGPPPSPPVVVRVEDVPPESDRNPHG